MNANNFFEQGVAAINAGNVEEAVHCFDKAVQKKPKDAETVACLGQSLVWQGKREQGIAQLRKAGQLLLKKAKKKRVIDDLIALTEQLQSCNDYQGSVKLIQQAIQITKTDARAFQLLAQAFSRLNQHEQALLAVKQAVKLQPENVTLKILLAELDDKLGNRGKARIQFENILDIAGLNAEQAYVAHKNLALILDKNSEFDSVFKHLQSAAELSHKLVDVQKQNIRLIPDLLAVYQQEFTSELVSRWPADEFEQERPAPIFLMGFLRSGTTLIQEVLAAHPQVFVADEAEFITVMQTELIRLTGSNASIPEQLRLIDRKTVKQLRKFYWQKVADYYGEPVKQSVFIDKTTMNIINLGLINCIFPDAKVIFAMRDPRDVCLSCFMQQMIVTPMTVHLLGWNSTANFYKQVMEWWIAIRDVITMDYFELRYELAVTEFDNTFRALFEYLALSWEPGVAEFHRQAAKKFVASPSYYQVSQPLYNSSLDRWRNYPNELALIETQLKALIYAFSYDDL